MRIAGRIASFQLMNGAAGTALEMMMMSLSGNLVAHRAAGNLNRGKPLLLDEAGDIPIYRCNTQGLRSL